MVPRPLWASSGSTAAANTIVIRSEAVLIINFIIGAAPFCSVLLTQILDNDRESLGISVEVCMKHLTTKSG
jgi:hypothetical protein